MESLFLSLLEDPSVSSFFSEYLTTRYSNIKDFGEIGFCSAQQFVQTLLSTMTENGVEQGKRQLFCQKNRKHFEKYYQTIQANCFKFDAIVINSIFSALPLNASVLDFGAGNNLFLPNMLKASKRLDLNAYATDYHHTHDTCYSSVKLVKQPAPDRMPNVGKLDIILMRRVAHHIDDMSRLLSEMRKKLKKNGKLILIEDTYLKSKVLAAVSKGYRDPFLTKNFQDKLSDKQKIQFLKINDYYSNYIFHDWTQMPLPLQHQSIDHWNKNLSQYAFSLSEYYYMGFPKKEFNLHQAATGIMIYTLTT